MVPPTSERVAQKIIDLDPSKGIEKAAEEFRHEGRTVLILLGDFPAVHNDEIRSLFSRAVIPFAVNAGALILDDARTGGCAALSGDAVLEQDQAPAMIGIVTSDRAAGDLDPNHELILRLPPVWSSPAKYWFQLAAALATDGVNAKRVAGFLFGGGPAEKKAVLCCARHGWPMVVVGKTGGLADEILAASNGQDGGSSATLDPDLREILETTTIYPTSLDAGIDDLNRILIGRILVNPETFTDTLREAWLRHDEIDRTAILKQAVFRQLQLALIVLAVLAAFFAILSSVRLPASWTTVAHSWYIPYGTLHVLVIVTPIALSIVAAYNSHFRDGSKWVLLRGAAEALKREIFRFRAQAGAYSDEQCVKASRESKLIAKVADITSSLEQSEVNKTTLEAVGPGYEEKDQAQNDRLKPLSPEQYIQARLRDQIAYFSRKTRSLSARLTLMQVLILITGGIGTLLAAMNQDVWVALATAVVTALTTKLQSDQIETTLVQYNQALASLKNVDAWWKALSSWEKGRRKNIDLLVDQTEKALESETAGWVQQMQSALDKLTEKEPQGGGSGSAK